MRLPLGVYCWFMLYVILYLGWRMDENLTFLLLVVVFFSILHFVSTLTKYVCAKEKSSVILTSS